MPDQGAQASQGLGTTRQREPSQCRIREWKISEPTAHTSSEATAAEPPDQAKALLKGQANSLRNNSGFGPRQGQLAIRLDTVLSAPVPIAVPQAFLPSTGTGTLEGARGSVHLVLNNVTLQ